MAPFTEDVSAEYFRTDDFAEDATVDGVSVNVIFDEEYAGAFAVEGETPAIHFAHADKTDPEHGDAVVVDGRNWRIVEVKRDPTGKVTTAILEEV